MLTIEEIKKELDAGREVELECVDIDGFKSSCKENKGFFNQLDVLTLRALSVNKVGGFTISFEVDGGKTIYISEENYKYFRIKRPAPNFDDLIDVAVKAVRDGEIYKFEFVQSLGDTDIIFLDISEGERRKFTHDQAQDGIDFINSLYTETFVIEQENDLIKTKVGATGKLLNGEEFTIVEAYCRGYVAVDECKYYLPFFVFKGATVTQKRGEV